MTWPHTLPSPCRIGTRQPEIEVFAGPTPGASLQASPSRSRRIGLRGARAGRPLACSLAARSRLFLPWSSGRPTASRAAEGSRSRSPPEAKGAEPRGRLALVVSTVRGRRHSLASARREVGVDGVPDDLWLAIERDVGRGKQLAEVADEHGQRRNMFRLPPVSSPTVQNIPSWFREIPIWSGGSRCSATTMLSASKSRGMYRRLAAANAPSLISSTGTDFIQSGHSTEVIGGFIRSAMKCQARSSSAGCRSTRLTPWAGGIPSSSLSRMASSSSVRLNHGSTSCQRRATGSFGSCGRANGQSFGAEPASSRDDC